jgi:hypothetical protein
LAWGSTVANATAAHSTPIRASARQGKDAGKLSDQDRAGLRKQALQWLKADVATWGKMLDKDPAKLRAMVQGQMMHWQQDTDLASVRDPKALE